MAKGFNGFPQGMGNMGNLVKQAQKLQQEMEQAKDTLKDKTIDVTSGGGAVKITITGDKEIKQIVLSKDVVDPEDVEMLQDLLMTSINEAIRQAEQMSAQTMNKITGNMNLPGGLF